MKKLYLIAILMVSVLVAVAGCSGKPSSPQPAPQSAQPPAPPAQAAASNPIEITSSGFNPQTATINSGQAVTFMNKDAIAHWPASAMHPTHKAYPGSDIAKCGSADEPSTFDACRGIPNGASYAFTFNEKGSWKYHDHLNPSLWGTIVVE